MAWGSVKQADCPTARMGLRVPNAEAPRSADGGRIVVPRESLISRYELLGRLASGGMADVFLARALGIADFEKIVVLKRIRPDKQDDPRFVGMLRDEARVGAVLDHPNIVHTYDVGIDEGGVFIAMEYIDGEDVRSLLDRVRKANETIPLPLALQIAAGAAAGLHHAHEQTDSRGTPLSIVHRDVSPANIIATRHSTVKLIDFGIAKAGTTREQTAVGTLKGKVAYMSPEQVRGLKLDRRSDLFALGIVIYELVTMVRPFEADNQIATMHQVCNEPHVPADERRPTLPEPLGRLLDRALAKDPADRYPTAFELLEDLERITRDFGLHALPGALGRYLEHIFGPKVPPWLTPAQARAHLSRSPSTQTARRNWDLSSPDDSPSVAAGDSVTVTSPAERVKRTQVAALPEGGSPARPTEASMTKGIALGFTVAMTIFAAGWWALSGPEPSSAASIAAVAARAAASAREEPRVGGSPQVPANGSPPASGAALGTARSASAANAHPHIEASAATSSAETPPSADALAERHDAAPAIDPEPPPEPAGDPAPRGPSKKELAAQRSAKADELLDEAGRAALGGRDAEALVLVERSLKLRRTSAGYAKLAMLACRLGDAKKARSAHAKLSGRARADVVKVCAARGIELPE